MSLTYDEIEQYLTKIFTGREYAYVEDFLLVFRFPSNEVKQRADVIYKKSFDDAVKGGMLPVSQLEELIEARNLITHKEIQQLKKLKSQLEAQEILLGKTTRVKANQERIKGVINRLRTDIKSIEFKKSSKLLMSAETKADEDKSFFVCSQCVYTEEGNLFWETHEAAKKETRLSLRDKILLGYLRFYSGLSVSVIREIARSSLWRIRYISSTKTSDPLFGVPSSCYSTDQLNLVYWSNYYQNIYEMMPEDRPSDLVIEDDESLDAYMKTFYEERNRKDAERRHTNNRSGRLSAFDAEEVIITRSHELYEDIEYDTPREAQKIKDRVDLKKRTKRGKA
jgi:hypothetical protein